MHAFEHKHRETRLLCQLYSHICKYNIFTCLYVCVCVCVFVENVGKKRKWKSETYFSCPIQAYIPTKIYKILV